MDPLTGRPAHREALRARLEAGPELVVVALCAAWCGTCGEFEGTFAALARGRPGALFVWLDVEDDAALLDDLEVESFPTLAVYRAGVPVHFGVSLPHGAHIERLLEALAEGARRPVAVPHAVAGLPRRLREGAG